MNVSASLLNALLDNEGIVANLARWKGEASIHTRKPVPGDVTPPFISISPDIAIGNEDGLTSLRPVVVRDIAVIGDQPDHYRKVEATAYLVRDLFHRKRLSITVSGYHVIDVACTGPIPGPTDNDSTVSRVVTLTIRLVKTP
jgi:hypothetical protein